jgi:ligand-binding sensor protein
MLAQGIWKSASNALNILNENISNVLEQIDNDAGQIIMSNDRDLTEIENNEQLDAEFEKCFNEFENVSKL